MLLCYFGHKTRKTFTIERFNENSLLAGNFALEAFGADWDSGIDLGLTREQGRDFAEICREWAVF
jgi:hypothetical protein